MTFTNVSFFLYLALSLLLYTVVPLRSRWAYLIVVGAVFYATLDVRFLYVLLTMVVATHLGCWLLVRVDQSRRQARLAILWGFIVAIVAWLFLVKWSRTQALDWFGAPYSIFPGVENRELIGLSIPIGMSFHVLQCISLLVDTYRDPRRWDPHLGRLTLYLGYLPQILAGPIERAPKMYPQFVAPRQSSPGQALEGLEWFVAGLFKKLVLADRFAVVLLAFNLKPQDYQNPLISFFMIFAFVAYIYMDLSGYTDMARGMSLWFGIDLSKNFEDPLKSPSNTEFWKRWHVTFHLFMRDYVFRPLRERVESVAVCIFTVFMLSALWHGLGLHFLLWGAAAFAVVMAEHALERRSGRGGHLPFRRVRSYVLVSLVCSLFFITRTETLPSLYGAFLKPFDLRQATSMMHDLGWRLKDLGQFVVLAFVIALAPERPSSERSDFYRWLRLVVIVFLLLLMKNPTTALHSYFRF